MIITKLTIHYPKIIWPILFISVQGCSEYKTELVVPDILSTQLMASEFTADERLNMLTNTLSFNEQIKSYSREELAIERHRLETSLETSSAMVLIKLALLYSLPDSGFYNTAKAREFLDSCRDSNRDINPEYLYLSSMIYTFLDERIAQQKSINTIKTKLDSEQNRNRALEEQLEALKTIEKTINNRSNSLSSNNPGYP